jgi:RNA polymerase sigma-70 factor (ECF subfamily)
MMEKTDILVINARNQNLSVNQRHLAFGELVNRFYDAAYRWAFAVLGERHQAQDAVQEAFVTAFQSLEQLREPMAFSGWLRQIVVSQAYRLVRGQQPDFSPIESTPDLPTAEPGPAAILEDIELKERVMTAVQTLPENEQIVTKLFYLNGYSQHEIARLLELPLTTVKKRLQYARRNLKGIMVSMVDSFSPQPEPVLVPVPVRKTVIGDW